MICVGAVGALNSVLEVVWTNHLLLWRLWYYEGSEGRDRVRVLMFTVPTESYMGTDRGLDWLGERAIRIGTDGLCARKAGKPGVSLPCYTSPSEQASIATTTIHWTGYSSSSPLTW
jgi:hypothetical protein